ncbi:MAG: hypothetical protein KAU60_01945 [Desulfobacterales bacterium]|nr:hypothetical protein [Desulfobacterales bacterium]
MKHLLSIYWTPQEQWVWDQVSQGEIADFNKAAGYGGELEPKQLERWPESRILRPEFLETILLREPYRGALTLHGVMIVGAWFKEPLDLSNAILAHQLALPNCIFDSDVNLYFLKTPHSIDVTSSKFNRTLSMFSSKVAGHLIYDGAEFADEIYLDWAKIGDQLSMRGCKFSGKLSMCRLQVDGDLFMHNMAEFADEVVLRGAKIGGQLATDGSKFSGRLDMNELRVGGSLLMRNVLEFSEEVDMHNAKIRGNIEMDGSKFRHKLNMVGLEVTSSLFMRNGAEFASEVDIGSAKVGGQLEADGSVFRGAVNMIGAKIGAPLGMNGSKFSSRVDMGSIQVEGSVFMCNGAEFAGEVVLRSAKIGGQLGMDGSKFSNKLNMDKLKVDTSVFMRNGAEFAGEVVLRSAKIGGQLNMDHAKFSGPVNMQSVQVSGSLFMRNSAFKSSVKMFFLQISGCVDLSGSKLQSLDLSGTKIEQEFCLGSESYPPVTWEKGAKLSLRNTEVAALKDLHDTWPDEIELVGFTYSRLGGFGDGDVPSMATREISWMKEWLEKQKSYSPGPYQQLSKVLTNEGYDGKATAVLFEGKKRQQEETKTLSLHWWLLVLQRLFIGYGYRNFRVFGWIIILWCLGTIILYWSGQDVGRKIEMSPLSYSIDMLLPIIELHKPHYTEITLQGWVRAYFYIHKVFGYVLASFLIAGLSGLTKK